MTDCYHCYKRIWFWQKKVETPRRVPKSMHEQFGDMPQFGMYISTPLTWHSHCMDEMKRTGKWKEESK